MKQPSSITPIPAPQEPSKSPSRIGWAAVATAVVTLVAQLVQAAGGLPEVVKAVIAQGWYAAAALALASVCVLIFQVIRSADAARVAADVRAEQQYIRMGAMLNEMGETMARIAEAQAREAQSQKDVAQALEGLRQQLRSQPGCPMRDAKTDPLAMRPTG